jgi:signal transduction histidine kinase
VIAEIRDHGAGIPQDLHEKIFELYFTTKQGGSGMGLAYTYQILQWHNGAVEFESNEGAGTTFRFRIPVLASALTENGLELAADTEDAMAKRGG